MQQGRLKYEIFSGIPDRDAVWIEAVEGLASALERMEKIAEDTPGPYFIFYAQSHSVVARMDTSFRRRRSESGAA